MIYRQIAAVAGLCWILSVCSFAAFAQNNVGIGTTQPNPHAVLQLVSPNSNQGFLIPSLTTAQRNAMSELTADDNGLMVFDLEEKTFYYWSDDQWVSMIGNARAGGDLIGNYPDPQLREGVVTTEKLAEGAVTSEKIQNNSIEVGDINATRNNSFLITTQGGSVFWETLDILERSDLPIGNIYVGTESGEASFLPAQGDGFILIGNGTSLTSVRTRGDVTFQGPDGYGDVQIVENAVTSAEIAQGAVGTSEIQDSSVINTDISETAAISGTKISPDFGAQGISTTGDLSVQNIVATGKATSAATAEVDAATTLTTKGYVDAEISAISNNLEDGNGITDFTYNGTTPATVSVNNGAGLNFDANGALQVADDGITATKINVDVAGDGIGQNSASGALNLDFRDIAREVASMAEDDLMAVYDADVEAMARISWLNLQRNISADNITKGTLNIDHLPNPGAATTTFGSAGSPIETIQVDAKGRVVNVTTGTSSSDRRLKRDIQPLDNSLEKLMKLQGYQYYWKDQQKDSTLQMGVIAQELEEIYPALVKLRPDNYKGVDYHGLVPVLIEAVKEQQKMIESLQSQLEKSSVARLVELQEENQLIRTELEMIKNALGLNRHSLKVKPKDASKTGEK